MAKINYLCERLRTADLFAEEVASPLLIIGGENVRDFDGIRVYKRGFSISYDGAQWSVKLPCGQTVEQHTITEEEELFKMIVEHFRLINEF